MASRIITKKGSGAPLASDLVHGELAVDTVNKRLYTEDAGGTVIEVGTNPSTIDINAGTIDGTVIGGTSAAAGSFTTLTASGDVNFDSNTLFVDASTNSVGIGTSSPSKKLSLQIADEENGINIASSDSNKTFSISYDTINSIIKMGSVFSSGYGITPLTFWTNQTERMRIDSSGNVGINTSSPAAKLEIGGAGEGIILASPDGTRYKITVANGGTLTVTAV